MPDLLTIQLQRTQVERRATHTCYPIFRSNVRSEQVFNSGADPGNNWIELTREQGIEHRGLQAQN